MKKTLIKISCSGKEEVRKLLHGFADDKHWWEDSGYTPSFTEDSDGLRLRLPLSQCVSAIMTSEPPYKTAYLKFTTGGTLDGFEEVSLIGILLVNFKTKRPEMRCIDHTSLQEPSQTQERIEELERFFPEDPLRNTRVPKYTTGDPDPSYLRGVTCLEGRDITSAGNSGGIK